MLGVSIPRDEADSWNHSAWKRPQRSSSLTATSDPAPIIPVLNTNSLLSMQEIGKALISKESGGLQ